MILAALVNTISWQQIDLNQKLILNDPIQLNQKITLTAGTKLVVQDIIPLDELRVLSYKMNITPCSAAIKSEVSDMVIINDLYGTQLDKDCSLNVYLELGDLSKPSLFSTIAR